MPRKFLLTFLLFLLVSNCVLAHEISLSVVPASKMSTSSRNLREGDSINFLTADDTMLGGKVYIKKDTEVTGLVTSLVHNDFTCQEASIYAENFRVKNVDGKTVKLKGIVYVKGRNHGLLTQFIPIVPNFPIAYQFIRGGEVKLDPQKDSFTLYLEVKDENL